jgi:hypothetical protein
MQKTYPLKDHNLDLVDQADPVRNDPVDPVDHPHRVDHPDPGDLQDDFFYFL